MAGTVRRRRPRVAGILRVQCPVLAGRFLVEEVEVGSQHGEHNGHGRHVAVSLLWIGAAIAFGLVADVWTLSVTCRCCLVVDDLRRRCVYYGRRVCVVSQLALEGRGLCGS